MKPKSKKCQTRYSVKSLCDANPTTATLIVSQVFAMTAWQAQFGRVRSLRPPCRDDSWRPMARGSRRQISWQAVLFSLERDGLKVLCDSMDIEMK